MLFVRRPTSDVRRPTSGVWRLASGVWRLASGVWRLAFTDFVSLFSIQAIFGTDCVVR
ncbi:hypothetical protein [Parathalassolituus penaei]|uniref:Uncharacterized protein n=1 Tax=Parathalassolituus penaei TaxID=2997323 RepID=A0A9X3EFG9_9GAMM|nr:hypothetical protein [Parathalassolituus penaei]MCY0966296.1 hypothetical protein [Parathalassolituus penaei]